MKSLKAPLLSQLDLPALHAAAGRGGYAKWGTLCQLRLAGLPTLDALCVIPGEEDAVEEAAARFCRSTGHSYILVRSDGGGESGRYYRGGNSFSSDAAAAEAIRLLAQGRAVLFVEPTNRFANELSINLRLESVGQLVLEVLGPGYDASDLNRGGVVPEEIITIPEIEWTCYSPLSLGALRRTRLDSPADAQARLTRRLEIIGAELLPNSGLSSECLSPLSAEQWLKEHGHLALWRIRPHVSVKWVRQFYDDAYLIAQTSGRGWSCLSCSATVLEGGRLVYWDVVDSRFKFRS